MLTKLADGLPEVASQRGEQSWRDHLCRDLLDRDTSDLYIVCSLAIALGPHPDHGPYPELTSIFYGIPDSFGRLHVARAMAETPTPHSRTPTPLNAYRTV